MPQCIDALCDRLLEYARISDGAWLSPSTRPAERGSLGMVSERSESNHLVEHNLSTIV